MKILVLGDLHGRKPRIHFKDFDAIIQVGDVCSDREFRPYIKQWVNHLRKHDSISLGKFLETKLKKEEIKQLEKKSVEEGRKILAYLNSFNVPVFFTPGNWDESYGKTKIKDFDKSEYNNLKGFLDYWLGPRSNPKLIKGLKNIRDCQYQLHKFKEVNMLGYGLSSNRENPKLRKKKREYTKEEFRKLVSAYEKIKNKLEKTYRKRDKRFPTVFISHNVPYKTKLDIILNKDHPGYKKHFGSTVAREFCQKYQPLVCVGGHMHENPGKDKIGKTTVINAGFGKDANVLIEVEGEKLKVVKFFR